jgi:hypothetical protein
MWAVSALMKYLYAWLKSPVSAATRARP